MTRKKKVVIAVGGTVAALAIFTGAAYAVTGDRVPNGTTVAGVAIGGIDESVAATVLAERLGPELEKPISVRVEGKAADVDPAKAGLSADWEKSVREAAGGGRWSPVRLWRQLVGGSDHPLSIDVDRSAADEVLRSLSDKVSQPAVEGTIVFEDGVARAVPGKPGNAIDVDRAPELLRDGLLGDDVVELPVRETEPTIDKAELDRAMAEFAEPAMSAPVVIRVPGGEATVEPKVLSGSLRMKPDDGRLVPVVNGRRLVAALGPAETGIGKEPKDARFEVRNGKPHIVPSRVGASLDPQELADKLPAALTASAGNRVIDIDTKVVDADFTTADAEALGVKEQVSTFTTYYPHAEYRNINIGRAAELVNGTLLKPGETFSLNKIVGERTVANGFTTGMVIQDGLFRRDLGGGVSQMATTTFNAMFFAGLEDVEHKPHSVYIDRYPEGREATVAWPSLDLRFKNTTPYGVFITARIDPSTPSHKGSATVSMYSTKYWDITATKSARYAPTSPPTRHLDAPDCEAVQGTPGFTVDVTRHFARANAPKKEVRAEKFHTVYIPGATVICGRG